MSNFLHDVRFAFRSLLKAPGFAALAVLTLALGIGGNTAIFSIVHAVLLEPLPFAEPERVVVIHNSREGRSNGPFSSSLQDYEDWRAEKTVFERMAMLTYWSFNLTGREVPERVLGARVTGEFFNTLGAAPLLGRTLTPADDLPAAPETVVLGYRLWQRAFAADRNVLGQVIPFEGRPHTVVGVMPADFRFPADDIEAWAAVKDNMSGLQRHNRFLFIVGRLAPGVSHEQATAAMAAVSTRLQQAYPQSNKGQAAVPVPALRSLVGDVQQPLLVLLGAVGCVLMIACANVGNLLLARTAARQRESAIRTALGAGRMRLLRQFLAENLLLGLTGGVAGVALGYAGLRLLVGMHPGGIPRLDLVTLNPIVFGFALALSLATGALLSLIPAWQASQLDVQTALREGARSAGSRGRNLIRNGLVIAEVALAVVLLVGGGLLLRSFAKLSAVEPGFAVSRSLLMSVFLTPPGYRTIPERVAYTDRALAGLQSAAGVEAVAAVTDPPLGEGWLSMSFYEEGSPKAIADSPLTGFRAVSEDYFRAMQIAMRGGRTFERADDADRPRVVVVNESFARLLWPNGDAIGKRVRWSDPQRDVGPMEIVGVVADVRARGLEKSEGPVLYAPIRQITFPWMRWFTFVTRTSGDPRALVANLRAAAQSADPAKPLFAVRTLDEALDESLAERRFNMFLLQVFAALALLLAGVGIYGVVAYSVAQRTQEIGIRMALGAQQARVLRMVLSQGMAPTLAGIAAGILGSLGVTRFLMAQLFEVSPTDPVTLAAVAGGLAVVAALACLLPARRATQVDPVIALRSE